MTYLVLDLETANPNASSICQIGLVEVEGGEVIGTASHLIDPQDAFNPWNVKVHGILPERVIGAPTFHQVFESLAPLLEGRIVVTHGSFDRVAITRACEKHRLPMVNARWLDNQTVVRRTWPQFARKGYSLGNLARNFDIAFQHHDALEDAIATAEVFKRALTESGRTAQEWLASIEVQSGLRARILQAGLVDGPFAGKTVVFTGRLRIARQEAARLAAMRGFDVGSAVTPATTLLCVGHEKEGFGKSAKEREAERLAAGGHPIAIVAEEEFWRMVRA